MYLHYLTIAWRNLFREKSYSVINIICLSLAVASCFLLVFWIKYELSYENCYPDNERIYRVLQLTQRSDGVTRSNKIRPGISNELKQWFPQIESSDMLQFGSLPYYEYAAETKDPFILRECISNNIEILDIFPFKFLEGTLENVIKERTFIITKEAAQRIWGNVSPVGKSIYFGSTNISLFTIGAVIELPVNTDLKFDILRLSRLDRPEGGNHFIKFKKDVKLTPELKTEITNFLTTIQGKDEKLELEPLRDMHLSEWEHPGRQSQLWLFGVIAFMALILAVINYVNTSIARAMNHLKEVGVRKITGSTRSQLIIRFLSDTLLLSLIAVVLALIITKILFPHFSTIMGLKTDLHYDFVSMLIAVMFIFFVSVLAGGYSAFYLSSFGPALLFRGGTLTGSRHRLRQALIGLQFFLCFGTLICTALVYKQLNHILNADTGVERNNIISIQTGLWYGTEDFIKRMKAENPNILEISLAGSTPFNVQAGYQGVSWEGGSDNLKYTKCAEISCDSHYADLWGLELIDGRFILPGLKWWQYKNEESLAIVVNETFTKMMGEPNPVGLTVAYDENRRGKIVGVVKDFNFKPLKEKIEPLLLCFNPEATRTLFVKTTGIDNERTLAFLFDEYRKAHNNMPLVYRTAEDEYDEMYSAELRVSKLTFYFSVMALLLSLLGVVSMISFMVEKRTKEIAIRKINGAKIIHIIGLFVKDVAVAGIAVFIPACIVAFYIMRSWIDNYVYRTTLDFRIFAAIPTATLLLTLLVVSVQVFFTARKNPLNSLRNE